MASEDVKILTTVGNKAIKVGRDATLLPMPLSVLRNAISNAVGSYIPLISDPITGNFPVMAANGSLTTSSYAPSSFSLSGHNHDDRYYTQTQLQTSGQAQVHWDNLTNIGIQSDILYWDSATFKYSPYSSKQSSLVHFYYGSTDPDNATRLNLDASLYATKLYSGSYETLTVGNMQSNILWWNSDSNMYQPYSSKQSSLLHFYLGTTNPDNTTRLNLDSSLYVTSLTSMGDITGDTLISRSVSFSSGLAGSGYKLWKDSNNQYNLELDKLTVRGTMNVFELRVNKYRATNGALLVSDTVKAFEGLLWDSTALKYYFTVEDAGEIIFQANDLIQSQAFNGKDVTQYRYKVYSVDTSNKRIYVVNPDNSTPTQVDISGKDFVRFGNASDNSRKSFILLNASSSDFDKPAIDVWDGVNSFVFNKSTQLKARIGNLQGLTFNGQSISGYGFWSNLAYLEGAINATSGKIGNWSISGGYLSASDSNGTISIGQEINMYDASGIQRVNIWKGNIGGVSYFTGGSSLSWTGANAIDYTTNVHILNSFSNLSNQSFYVQSQSTLNDIAIKTYSSLQSSSYHINIASNKTYYLSYKMRIYITYNLDADDEDPTDGLTYENYINGSYQISATVYAYNSSGVLLGSSSATSPQLAPQNGSSYANYLDVAVNLNLGLITTSQVYFRIVYSITNSVNERRENTVWKYINGDWVEDYTYTTYHNLTITYNVCAYEVYLKGVTNGFVQIGKSGFQNIYDATKYWRTSSTDLKIVDVYGQQIHRSVQIGEVMWIERNNSDTYYPVLHLRQATPGTTGKVIQFQAGSTNNGYIQYSTSTKALSFVSDSDERLKEDIKESTLDALSIIKAVPLKEYTFKDNKAKAIGWVAQDLLKVYPQAVANIEGYREKGEYLGIAKDYLIEVLWRAVQQLIDKVEQLNIKT